MKKYIINADVVRIFAGLSVVFIHVSDPFLAYPPYYGVGGFSWLCINIINVIARVSVPLFFMLSGYLLLRPEIYSDFKQFFKKRFLRVGIPFVFWIAIYFIYLSLNGTILTPAKVITQLLSVNISVYYFIVIIVELYFIAPLLLLFIKHTSITSHRVLFFSTLIFTIGLSIINATMPQARVLTQKNVLTIFLPYIVYFFGGYFIKMQTFTWLQKYLIYILFILTIFFTVFFGSSGQVVNSYYRLFDSPNVVAMSFFIFILIVKNDVLKKLVRYERVVTILKQISGTIFGVFLVHIFIIVLLDRYYSWIPGRVFDQWWVIVFIKSLAVFVISYGIVVVGKKIPGIRWMFG